MTLDGGEALRELLVGRRVSSQAWGKLYRADLFPDVRFPDGRVFEDIATTHRLVMRVGRVACVPGALVNYREREGSISKQHTAANLVDYWRAYLERYEELKEISGDRLRHPTLTGVPQDVRAWAPRAGQPASRAAD